ncbi:phospho-N-acetylmuramoyl-pentapeptide-transferase [Candidatus Falkowbacteria bacterium CG10_big_fil_rev_8_21_14_0_10_39_9]|uniref:Phospho-N-acetylmuramoyl-pentapeptide-transferase n=1 Tax=Candidatus Falkowbacteria bacterium CG10_big_fil_rev_8_21_14_0_10_39_9 TaxID=1974566 RepID=A0A2M6WPW7_9BACT|nr:MAG: phospho-N-acetylmuramoyl-pentapeptide-transferase [Candidatus Falkowbacteria bacterium CG10_big_fil_rev_8_21_14_0_10_39_9]
MMDFYLIKIIFLSTLAFVFAISWTPLLTNILYKYKLGKQIRNSGSTPIFSELHAHKAGTPTMGGVLMWGTLLVFILFFYVIGKIIPIDILKNLNFLTQKETFLPLGALIFSALIGLIDDWLDVRGKGMMGGGGLKMRHRLWLYTIIAVCGALWFYFKLDWTVLHVPFLGNYEIGWWYIPIFILVIVATSFSVNETDGLDGLAGGTLLVSYVAYGIIAFSMGRYDLAAFCGVLMGAMLAFLWFNIAPARFYMGDTGSMSLGVTLGIIALLTNNIFILPFIGFVFVLESGSVIIQLLSKKFRHKKVFLSAPIHHHYQAIGWPETKVVMRFWLIAAVMASVGLMIFLLDKNI